MDAVLRASDTIYRYGRWEVMYNVLLDPFTSDLVRLTDGVTLRGDNFVYSSDPDRGQVPISGDVHALVFRGNAPLGSFFRPYSDFVPDRLSLDGTGLTARIVFAAGTRVEDLNALSFDWLFATAHFESLATSGFAARVTVPRPFELGTEGDDVFRMLPGIGGYGDSNTIHTYGGDDTVFLAAGPSRFDLGEGDDRLEVLYPFPEIYITAGLGDDTIIGAAQAEYVDADETGVGEGAGGQDLIRTHDGNDSVNGGGGDDRIFAGEGADNVLGGAGDDQIFGGSGDDYVYSSAPWSNADATPFERFDGTDDDIVFAGPGDDQISTGIGDDIAGGGLGDDRLYRAPGSDLLFGNDGDDLFIHEVGFRLGAVYSAASDRDTLVGGAGRDMFFIVEDQPGMTIIRDVTPQEDQLAIINASSEGFLAFTDAEALAYFRDTATIVRNGIRIDFDAHSLILRNITLDDLSLEMFL